MSRQFRDRTGAGQQLAARLAGYANRSDVIVLALPRGGVPVAFEVAKALGAPLDVFLVRKLGVPGWEELAFGAIASGGIRVLNPDIVQGLNLTNEVIDQVATVEQQELERRERKFRGDRPAVQMQGHIAIVVDDGIATGATVRAAVQAIRQQAPASVVLAVPIAPPHTCRELRREVDDLVCLKMPMEMEAIGLWYKDFAQTTDAEVCELLARAKREQTGELQPIHS